MNTWRIPAWIWTACTGSTLILLCLLGQPPVGWTAVAISLTNLYAVGGGWMIGIVGTELYLAWRSHRRARGR